jgi:catechol 2,3-dioxygenase-like lactoylglutathione lyase family enzyme
LDQWLSLVTLVVRDYDEAIEFYCGRLKFELLEDTFLEADKRWVVVRPCGPSGTALLLAKATTPEQRSTIGRQAGGRVGFFLNTDDVMRDYRAFQSLAVEFLELPRHENYGIVAVFVDLYGNKWDLIQAKETR